MTERWMIGALAGAFLLAVLLIRGLKRIRRMHPLPMDEMEGREFEEYCADLLEGAGFAGVMVTPASRDFGADILCEKDGVTYAVQCKCYDAPVGVSAVQEAYAGKDFYGRMVAVVMTNQYFTDPAAEMAHRLRVLLWDRDVVESLAGTQNAG